MKAIVLKKAGSPEQLALTDVPRPVPGSDEILIRVHAASVTRGDIVMRKMPRLVARLFGETPKSIPGYEFAGRVEAIGEEVTTYAVGDRVFGTTTGLARGAYAEYICVPEDGIVAHMPTEVGYAEAAPIPVGAMTALAFLHQAGPLPGERVLINGASGSVGSYAVQIAKQMGTHVTGVVSTSNTELVASLGADAVIDYTRQDFVQAGLTFDVIFDAAGKTSAKKVKPALAGNGRFVTTRTRRRERVEDLGTVRDMASSGAVKAIVDRTFPLAEIVEAHRYVEDGGKRGNVVVIVVEG